jgi:copper resistance protein D
LSILYFFLTWFHLLAAIAWIGGMIFLSLVLAPLVRSRKAAPEFMALFRSAARRFRLIVWIAMALLLSTGPLLLHERGLSLLEPSGWPHIVRVKLGLVGILFLVTGLHDLLLGPRLSHIGSLPESARTPWDRTILRTFSWVPRLALLLSLGVLAAAVVLARL